MTEPPLDPAVLDNLRTLSQPGHPDVLREALTVFLEDAPPRIEAISSAIGHRDHEAMQKRAHALKGAAGAIGAWRLHAICQEIETIGQAGSVDGATRFMQELRDEFSRVKQSIGQLLL